jgi:FHA domain/TIR domain
VVSSANSSDRERYIIGRGKDCHINVSDPTVSKAHSCLIIELDGTYTLVDIGSTSGTSVYRAGGWKRIREERVAPEDRVLIGGFETTLANLLVQLQDVKAAHAKVRDKLFISYRRADTEQVAGRIFDFLSERYGADHVFFDTDAIPGAVDFCKRIQSAINDSSSVLTVIGPNWSSRRRSSLFQFLRRRPSKVDFVEVEIEEAIRIRVPIIPILVMGALMPTAEMLAPSIRSIVKLNALSVRGGRDFHQDMNIVSQTIDRYRPGKD